MYLIRRARIEDLDTLLKLAKMVYFINLPADQDIITAKVLHSRDCFRRAGGFGGPATEGGQSAPGGRRAGGASKGGRGIVGLGQGVAQSDMFMFALEDTETGSVLGTSQVISHMGGPGNPNVSFKLGKREFFSQSLQTGATHTTVTLHLDESGPTEIGGLILQPSYRRHRDRLGRFLSLIRFHFVGLHRARFADRVIAEMMAPITPDGQNLLWEYLGRRFINLTYGEADRFCQSSREFMTSLLPREELYLTLLPPEARALVGQVGPETVPARKLLENLGFMHEDLIDPFDGGPYLQADTDKITIVKATRRLPLGDPASVGICTHAGFVSHIGADGEFRAIQTPLVAEGGVVRVPAPASQAVQASPGDHIGVTAIEPLLRHPAGDSAVARPIAPARGAPA